MAPRHVLRHVLELYAQRGWEPVVAPELEFYLVEPNIDAGLSAEAAGRPLGPRRAGPPGLQHRRGQRVRPAVRRHLRVLRGPGHRDRHADPRGRRRRRWRSTSSTATRSIWPTRRSCSSARRARPRCATRCTPPSWPSRTPRSRAAPCTSTRASSTRKTRKNIFSQRRRHADAAVLLAHRRPAEIPAGGDGAVRART